MDKDEVINLIAENIRIQRLRKRLTQEALAEMAGVSTKYINSIETKKVNPSITVIVNICKSLNIDLNKIICPLD